jgi:integrase
VPPSTRRAASAAQVEAILTAAAAEVAQPRRRVAQRRQAQTVADLVTALWFSGLRSIEALRLLWVDVDLDRATWTIRSPANKGGTVVLPVHREVLTMLRRRRLLGQAGPFQGVGDREAWRKFKARHPELEQRHLHSLRHSFVTRMVETGNLAAARHTGRHRTPEMTDLYTHVGPETFRAALEAL